ncbi:hypothetical protein IV71_GL000769 [Fructobacillus fructosus KCTC 3544]|nr:hypothetical protein IV71_GL000769 [Fructobacillus fructosus KCTC 3544]
MTGTYYRSKGHIVWEQELIRHTHLIQLTMTITVLIFKIKD